MGMQELQVTVLGPANTGKTTLLTAMYEQFEKNIKSVNLELTPDDDTSCLLQDRLIELKSAFESFESRGRAGLEGTEASAGVGSLKSFDFGLGKKQSKPSLRLSFRDYPGAYHNTNSSKEEKQFIKRLLRESAAVLIPIDATALMEEKGKYHERINRPQQIKDLFKKAYIGLESPRLIILAPVKCEKYLQDDKAAEELTKRVKEGYQVLLDYLDSSELKSQIAIVVTPVQTVGGLVFSRIEVDENNIPDFYFRKIRHDAKYEPKDSEQPLRYLLSFLLKLHLQHKNTGFFSFIREWIGSDDHLKRAIKEFSRGCKTSGGFTVLEGQRWLS